MMASFHVLKLESIRESRKLCIKMIPRMENAYLGRKSLMYNAQCSLIWKSK